MGFTLGKMFRLTVFGESHGKGVGVVVDGCPPGLKLDLEELQKDMDRRRPGQSMVVSLRKEEDLVQVMSGFYNDRTTGGPLTLYTENTDVQSGTYSDVAVKPRPSHLDYTAHLRYRGYFDYRGGGFLSGRITAPMVMGGSVAKQALREIGVKVHAYIVRLGQISLPRSPTPEELEAVYESPVRCPVADVGKQMEDAVMEARKQGDSLGAVVECIAEGVPAGYGDPVFDSVESQISSAMYSIPAVKGVEFGAGFKISEIRGSEANDEFYVSGGRVLTRTNNNGGVLGGITTGMPVVFRVAFKPTASIPKPQNTVNLETMTNETITVKGRHDPCVAIRGTIVVENLAAAVLADVLYPELYNHRF
ncbi:MAG: chorismate synthase [Thermoprotei archaeon]